MPDSDWYYVKNWWEHQDYRYNYPSWIKLWKSIESDPTFLELSEIHQWRLVKLWLYASENQGRLPRDHKKIGRRLGAYHQKMCDDLIAIFIAKDFISQRDVRGIPKIKSAPEEKREKIVNTQADSHPKPRKAKPPFEKPTLHQVVTYMQEIGIPKPEFEAEGFLSNHESKGWRINRQPMVSWKAAVQTWKHNLGLFGGNGNGRGEPEDGIDRIPTIKPEGDIHAKNQ